MRFKVVQEISFEPNTGVFEVESSRFIPILNRKSGNIIRETGRVTNSTFKYGLISFPSKGQLPLKEGDSIKIKYHDIIVPVKMSSVRGRISGITRIVTSKKFFEEFNPGDDIILEYDQGARLLELRK